MKILGVAVAGIGALLLGRQAAASTAAPATSSVLPAGDSGWTRFDADFKREAAAAGISTIAGLEGWKFLKAISVKESDVGRDRRVARGLAVPTDIEGSKSSDGKSWGVMQVTLPTALDLDPTATVEKLNNAQYSIRLGAQYFKWLSKQFNPLEPRYLEWVVKSYNQGIGNTRKERLGEITGYAKAYWDAFQTNIKKV